MSAMEEERPVERGMALERLAESGELLQRRRDALGAATADARAAVLAGAEAGVPEAMMARLVGVTRVTVRAWLRR